MDKVNENAALGDGARKFIGCESNQSHGRTRGNSKEYEDRRNSAACFKNPHKGEEQHADYIGVTVVEGLPDASKVWVNVDERTARNGQIYLTVTLRPCRGR